MELRDHQEKILKDNKDRCLIAYGTGSGKTFISLKLTEGMKTLVVTTKEVRDKKQFEDTLKHIPGHDQVTVISKEDLKSMYGRGVFDGEDMKFDAFIIDESHFFTGVSPNTKRSKGGEVIQISGMFEVLYKLIREQDPEKLYLLSATPVSPSNPMTVYATAKLLHNVSWDFFKFRDRYFKYFVRGYREVWVPKNTKKAQRELSDLVKAMGYTGKLEDWFDVPDQNVVVHMVDRTKEQERAIKDYIESDTDPMVRISKELPIDNGIYYGVKVVSGEDGDIMMDHTEYFENRKIEYINKYAEMFKKVVVFARFRGQIDLIEKELTEKYKKKVLVLDGRTKDNARVITEANDFGEVIIVIQSQKSAGYELPGFPCMVFASLSSRAVDHIQAKGRIQRMNNIKENTYVYLVTKGGSDERCYNSIMKGQDFQEMIGSN